MDRQTSSLSVAAIRSRGWERGVHRAGRVLLAALFAIGAAQKVLDPQPVMTLLTGMSLPVALIWPAALFNAWGAVALVAGYRLRFAAMLLAGYCGLTSVFHFIPADPWQMSIFVKNWAIAGGLLVLASTTPPSR